MPGENNYAPGVTAVKPKKTCLILLGTLLFLASLLAAIFFATTIYFALARGCANNGSGEWIL